MKIHKENCGGNGEERGEPRLGRRIDQVVDVLATKVRVMVLEQIAETWFADAVRPQEAARAGLRQAEREGLLATTWEMAHPRIPLLAPLYRYRADEKTPEPDFGRLSWQARRRFRKPLTRMLVARGTTKAKRAFGRGDCRRSQRPSDRNHDLHVTELFLRFRRDGRGELWKGEDELLGTIRPDAMMGEIAIDFIGQYSKSKLAALHRQYIDEFLAFELW
jgi:hypothetical protein